MLLTILVFLLVLSALVLVHEFGHYIVAKKLGVKVEEFGFGFPPRVFGKKIGETIYSFNLLPIGGFVKLYGEDEAGAGKIGITNHESRITEGDQKRAFIFRPVWQRGAIVIAGVVMNFLLAVAIISYLFTVAGVPTPKKQVIIAGVAKNSPAAKVGLHVGDTILSINNTSVTTPDMVIKITKNNVGKEIELQIESRIPTVTTVRIIPRKNPPPGEGSMGVAISAPVALVKYPWYKAPFVGTWESLKESWLILAGFGDALSQAVVQKQVPQGLTGPVGIAQLTGQFIKVGPNAVLSLVSLLSLNLAVLNILPIPALDGGRLFFILIEGVTRKKVHPKFEGYAHAIGMAVLLGLVAFITLHDLLRIFTGQPLLPKQ